MYRCAAAMVLLISLLGCKLTVVNSGGGLISSGDGNINCGTQCSVDYEQGAAVFLVAHPDAGYMFSGWSGACSGTEPCQLTVDNDLEVSARFEPVRADLALNGYTSCILQASDVVCWGKDDYQIASSAPKGLDHPFEISLGGYHGCVNSAAGVECWGNPWSNALEVPQDLENPIGLAVGTASACVIDNGNLRCWGLERIANHPALSNVIKVDLGSESACAIYKNVEQNINEISCWGDATGSTNLLELPGLINPVDIAVSRYQACAIDNNGAICWGSRTELPTELVEPTEVLSSVGYNCVKDINGWNCVSVLESYNAKNIVPNNPNANILAISGASSCALENNEVTCSGWGSYGETTPPGSLGLAAAMATGPDHTCVILEAAEEGEAPVKCWGSPSFEQLVLPTDLSSPNAISAGDDHTCVIEQGTTPASINCWGRNHSGQLDIPVDLGAPTAISMGGYHSCAIADDSLRCWGGKEASQWTPDHGQANVPESLTSTTAVAAGARHTCAIDNNQVVCWGDDQRGQSTPPSALTNPTAISAGYRHSCALSEEGVTCWGDIDMNVELINPSVITSGRGHACAVTDNGVLCWGDNFFGALSPANIMATPTALEGGGEHTCALENGHLKCWGGLFMDQSL